MFGRFVDRFRGWLRLLVVFPALLLLLVFAAPVVLAAPLNQGVAAGGAVAGGGMGAQAIIAVSAAVVTLTQLVKWANLPDKWGPLAVLVLSAIGVAIWAYSQGGFSSHDLFDTFSGWITVATSAAGVFGFTRAAASAVISAKPPPANGAGSSPTVPSPG